VYTFLFVTFFVPLLVLTADYIQKTELELRELIKKSGPDLCSLALGASVPVFMDPRVIAAFAENGPGVEFVGILLIFILRGGCIRLNRQTLSPGYEYMGTILGTASIFFVGAIMTVGYLKAGGSR
jgi:hypothetical protein